MRSQAITTTGIAAILLALTACGGGGNGSVLQPGPTPAPTTGPTSTPTPAVRTFTYEALPSPGNEEENLPPALAQIRAQGARGFRIVNSVTEPGSGAESLIYVKDAQTTFTYEYLEPRSDLGNMTAQLNAQGARGFKPLFVNNGIYEKDNAANTTYSYVTSQPAQTADAFLAEANARGAEGYYTLAIRGVYINGKETRIYEKDNRSNARFEYMLMDRQVGGGDSAFRDLLNQQGARGYRFIGNVRFSDTQKFIFVKDTAQSATFTYFLREGGETVNVFLQQLNEEGRKGSGLLEGAVGTIWFFTPANCTGRLCAVTFG